MPRILDRQAVQAWLSGQRAAAGRIQAERTSFLLSLTPERSLEVYLELWRFSAGDPPKAPSPVLLAMRRALSRLEEAKKG